MISRYVVWEMDFWNGKFLSDIQSRWWQFNRNCPKGDWMDVISNLASGVWKSAFHMPPPAPNCLSHSAPGFRWYWGGHDRDVWRISSLVLVVVEGEVLDPLSVFLRGILSDTPNCGSIMVQKRTQWKRGSLIHSTNVHWALPIKRSTVSWLCRWEH